MIPLSPVHYLPTASKILNIELFVKREDLFPFTGGGNKARIINCILSEEEKKREIDSLITTGGVQSNLARTVALKAAEKGWKCFLVLHGPENMQPEITGNFLLMYLTGANIKIVSPEKIHDTLLKTDSECKAMGLQPFFIEGGGHSLAGFCAHFEAAEELAQQCQDLNWIPEWIVLASGTGTTQAGLTAGLQKLGAKAKVIGISVARRNPRGLNVVLEAYNKLCAFKKISPQDDLIHFRDEWVGEGYEQASNKTLEILKSVGKSDGLLLDPTYTAKAFLGLTEMVHSGEIPRGARVLFWHTGGLMNLLAAKKCIERMV